MYVIHRFHLKIDRDLIVAIDNFKARNYIKTREEAVNLLFETLEPYIDQIVSGFHKEEIKDISSDYSDEGLCTDVILNIRDYNFDKLRFLHFRFKTLSLATVLRRLLRLVLILKSEEISKLLVEFNKLCEERVAWSCNFETHMYEFEPKTTMEIYLDYKYRIKNITVHIKRE